MKQENHSNAKTNVYFRSIIHNSSSSSLELSKKFEISKNTVSKCKNRTVFEDKSQRKWIGTSKGGINIIDPQKQKFHTVSHDPGIMNEFKGNSVSFLYETADSLLWIGTDEGGINIWDRKTNSFKNIAYDRNDLNSLPSNAVTSVKSDADNNMWVATFNSGIIKLKSSIPRTNS